jgi:hypothetical protein
MSFQERAPDPENTLLSLVKLRSRNGDVTALQVTPDRGDRQFRGRQLPHESCRPARFNNQIF